VTPTEPISCAFSVARASRNPALEELYFTPPHSGNNAVENGNADLDSEHSVGFDVSLWWRSSIASGEVTFFANRINEFIFRRFTGAVDEESGLAVTEFDQADASMKGIESHVDLRVTPILWVEGGLDYVRGDLTSFDLPMPQVPPLRGLAGVHVRRNAFQIPSRCASTRPGPSVTTICRISRQKWDETSRSPPVSGFEAVRGR